MINALLVRPKASALAPTIITDELVTHSLNTRPEYIPAAFLSYHAVSLAQTEGDRSKAIQVGTDLAKR